MHRYTGIYEIFDHAAVTKLTNTVLLGKLVHALEEMFFSSKKDPNCKHTFIIPSLS